MPVTDMYSRMTDSLSSFLRKEQGGRLNILTFSMTGGQILSKYHRRVYLTTRKTRGILESIVRASQRANHHLFMVGARHLSQTDLRDLNLDDFDPVDVKIRLKWDSGAAEVVILPPEARKFTVAVQKRWKLPQQWPWGGGKP